MAFVVALVSAPAGSCALGSEQTWRPLPSLPVKVVHRPSLVRELPGCTPVYVRAEEKGGLRSLRGALLRLDFRWTPKTQPSFLKSILFSLIPNLELWQSGPQQSEDLLSDELS